MNPSSIIAAARLKVHNRHPYVSAVLMSLRPVPTPGIGTMSVDEGWRLYYDPEAVLAWGVGSGTAKHDGTAAAVYHEVWHCLKQHFKRMLSAEEPERNYALDREINCHIVNSGWRFPIEVYLPKQINMPDGLIAEKYYQAPRAGKSQKPPPIAFPGCGGKCGGAAGAPNPWEKGTSDPAAGNQQGQNASSAPGGQGTAPLIPPPVSQADQDILRRVVAREVLKHIQAKGIGSMPGGLREWAEEYLAPPRIPWQQRLAALVRGAVADKSGAHNYTYSRPSRRQWGLRATMARAPILPALRCPLPDVGIVLDVSGSMMSGGERSPISYARSEVLGIVAAIGCPCKTYATDVAVAGVRRVSSKRDLVLLGETGGGTDLRSGIKQAEKDRAAVVILLTDGATPWPEPGETKAKLLAAITPDGDTPPKHIPFVQIEED